MLLGGTLGASVVPVSGGLGGLTSLGALGETLAPSIETDVVVERSRLIMT